MPKLEIRLLGAPDLRLDGKPVGKFVTRKAQALLLYLICTRRSHTRDALSAFLWPEAGEGHARNSLRRALSNVRELVGGYVVADRQEIYFDRERSYWLDVEALTETLASFPAHLQAGQGAALEVNSQALEAAMQLYQGEFMAGFHLPDAPAFDEWALYQREHLRALALRGLSILADHYIQADDVQAGLATTRRLLALEPWYETGHQRLMLLLARSGDSAAALKQYELCQAMLAEEFGLPPSAETIALYQQIKAGETRRTGAGPPAAPPVLAASHGALAPAQTIASHADLDDIPRRSLFVGRKEELHLLRRRHLSEGATVLALLGMGGVGKTSLAAEYAGSLLAGAPGSALGPPNPGSAPDRPTSAVDRVLWLSLLNAPPLGAVLRIWLQTLSGQRLAQLPETLDEQLALLFDHLRRQRCLLVLDNVESILQVGAGAGRFRAGYEGYALLIRQMAELSHRSSLLLTSRDLPAAVARLAQSVSTVCVVDVHGLSPTEGMSLLARSGMRDDAPALLELVRHYSGNPLALKLAADTVRDLFAGNTAAFLDGGPGIFGDIRDVLDQQFARLSDLERELLTWLAVERTPISPDSLWQDLAIPPLRAAAMDAMLSLQRSSLVDWTAGTDQPGAVRLTLQNVVMEYVTAHLLHHVYSELESGRLNCLHRHALLKAQAQEYVQESQRRLLLRPAVDWMIQRWGKAGMQRRLHDLLDLLRASGASPRGYAGANLLHLLIHQPADLRGVNLSRLAIREADLRTASLPEVDLRGADLTGTTFSDSFGLIHCIAVSPDSRYLAAGGTDGIVHLWRTADYHPVRMLQGHGHAVSSLAFTQDSRILASCGYDGLIRLWDVQTGELVRSLGSQDGLTKVSKPCIGAGHLAAVVADKLIQLWAWNQGELIREVRTPGPIVDVALAPDGRFLASVGVAPPLGLWDATTGELLRACDAVLPKLTAVAVSAGGQTIATGGTDNLIRFHETGDLSAHRVVSGHGDEVLSLAFSPDGRRLVSGSADRTARVWDVETGQPLHLLSGHQGWVTAVAYSPDGQSLVTGSYDQGVRLWEAHTGELAHMLQGSTRRVDVVEFSPDGRLLASSSYGDRMRLWQVEPGRLLHTLPGPKATSRAIAFSRNGRLVACGSDDHTVRVWTVESGELVHVLLGHRGHVRNVSFSPDSRFLVTGGRDRMLRVWDLETGQLLWAVPSEIGGVRNVAFAPDGAVLAHGALDSSVKLLHLVSGEVVHSLSLAPAKPAAVAFDPTGKWLACGTHSGAVWIWQVDAAHIPGNCALGRQVNVSEDAVWRLLFCPSGRMLAANCEGRTTHVIEVGSGRVCYSIPSRFGALCLAFSRDGRRLLTDGADNSVLVRDAASGEVLKFLRGHAAGLTSLATSPARDLAASTSIDGTVRLWDLNAGECVAVLEPPGPYAGMKIAGATGITPAQRATLLALGAVED